MMTSCSINAIDLSFTMLSSAVFLHAVRVFRRACGTKGPSFKQNRSGVNCFPKSAYSIKAMLRGNVGMDHGKDPKNVKERTMESLHYDSCTTEDMQQNNPV